MDFETCSQFFLVLSILSVFHFNHGWIKSCTPKHLLIFYSPEGCSENRNTAHVTVYLHIIYKFKIFTKIQSGLFIFQLFNKTNFKVICIFLFYMF